MSRVAAKTGELVEATPRKVMTRDHREKILWRQDGHCAGCMRDVGFNALPFEVDHVIPIFFNGSNADFNLMALCKPCHKIKTAADIKAIAQAKRRMAKFAANSPFRPAKRQIASRPFQKGHTNWPKRSFNR